jgi:hypothetical protein
MKTKTLLAFTFIVMLSIGACGPPNGERLCPPGYSCGYPTYTSVLIIFQDGSQKTVSTGINGCIAYYSRNHGDCGYVFRIGNNFGFFLTASPSGVDLTAPPSSVAISGQGMSGAYGMPKVEYFDGDGYQIGTVTATWVSGDGTQLTAPIPDLSYAYSGTYQVVVTNAQEGGYYIDRVGTATMDCWGRDHPDSDGDGVYDEDDCYPWDSSRWECDTNGCGQQDPHGIQMPCYEY